MALFASSLRTISSIFKGDVSRELTTGLVVEDGGIELVLFSFDDNERTVLDLLPRLGIGRGVDPALAFFITELECDLERIFVAGPLFREVFAHVAGGDTLAKCLLAQAKEDESGTEEFHVICFF